MLIDSHAHLTSNELEGEASALIERALESGVEAIVNIATTPDELSKGIALQKKWPQIVNVAATTPHDVEKQGEAHFDAIAEQGERLVAIGETGLDYYYTHSDKEIQKDFLRRYLRLARALDKPVVIHCREAFHDFFQILSEEGAVNGVLHCFTGTLEEAEEVVRRGWYLSLSGIVTFKKSEALREVARKVPLDQLLIETDSPYLAPTPYRSKRNEPAFLLETAKCIAQERGISLEVLAKATADNARTLFNF